MITTKTLSGYFFRIYMSWEYYLLNLLVFVFGYITCKTFYFFNSARLSVLMIKLSHVICLTILSKCIEAYSFATYTKLRALSKTGMPPGTDLYEKTKADDTDEVERFKEAIILSIIAAHPERFRTLISFNDWNSAMNYLQENRQVAAIFLTEGEKID